MCSSFSGNLVLERPYIVFNYILGFPPTPKITKNIAKTKPWKSDKFKHDFFEKNHRLSMMPRMLDKLSTEKKKLYNECLDTFNAKLFPG